MPGGPPRAITNPLPVVTVHVVVPPTTAASPATARLVAVAPAPAPPTAAPDAAAAPLTVSTPSEMTTGNEVYSAIVETLPMSANIFATSTTFSIYLLNIEL